jgi:hypothetical protein
MMKATTRGDQLQRVGRWLKVVEDSGILSPEAEAAFFAPIIKYEEKQFYVAKRGKPKWVRSGPVLREEG